MPMGCDYGDTCPAEPIDNDGDLDWELDEEKLKEDMGKSTGFGAKRYQDYQTRRDRTEQTWKHWEGQAELMADAFMEHLLSTKGNPGPSLQPEELEQQVGIEVIDIFGELFIFGVYSQGLTVNDRHQA